MNKIKRWVLSHPFFTTLIIHFVFILVEIALIAMVICMVMEVVNG